MRKTELLSGRVKKVIGTDLDPNRYVYLDLKNAEPDAGLPTLANSILASSNTGTRSWLSTSTSLSGLSVNAGALIVNEDTVAVDTNGFVNTTANNLHQVLLDLDQNLGTTTANALTVVVTDATIDGNGTTGSVLSIGQGVRPTDDPHFQGLQVAPQDAVSAVALTNPLRVTTGTAHDLANGDLVTFRDVGGTTQINGVDYYVTVIDANNVDLYSDQALTTAIDGTGSYSAWTSGGYLIGGGFRFPNLDGDTGGYLKTDGLGQLNFARPVTYSATQPSNPDTGDFWYDSAAALDLLVYDGSAWVSATSGGAQSAFTLRQFQGDGTTTVFNTSAVGVAKILVFLNGILLRLTDDFTYNSSTADITFLAAPTNGDTIEVLLTGDADLVGLELLGIANHDLITVDTSGNVTLTGELDMANAKIVNLATPTASTDAATKAYVDSIASDVTVNTTGDTGTGSVNTGTQSLGIVGTTNQIVTVAANQAITISLPEDVTVVGDLSADTLISTIADGTAPMTVTSTTLVTNLNADQLDGQEGSYYLSYANLTGVPADADTTYNISAETNAGGANLRLTDSDSGTDDVLIASGTNVTVTRTDANTITLSSTDTITNTFDEITVTDTDAGYTWTETGTAAASGTTGELTFVSGTDTNVDVDATLDAIRFTNTSTLATVTGRGATTTADISANTLTSTVVDGTAPLVVASTTLVTNLNADQLDGQEGSYYLDWTNTTNKPDPVITLGGDLTGSATLTDLGNATLTATINANSVALGTDTTGNYVGEGAVAGVGLSGALAAEGGVFTVTSNATDANTASTIVARDAAGDFTAGTITADLTGNADTADAWSAGRTISLTGDVTGISAAFDGSGDLSFATTIAANSVALGTDTTGNYVATITGTANEIEVTGSGSETATITIGLPDDVTIGNDLIVTGDFTVLGTQTTVNSTTVTIDDPTFTLGGDTAPISDDNKDRGIEFNYFDTTAKVGFFGFDDSSGKFTFIPDATNTSEVFSGTTGEIDAKVDWTNILNPPASATGSNFATVSVTDTDTGFTWVETGNVVADIAADTITLVSGVDINVDIDATLDAVRIANTSTLASVTGRGATTTQDISANTLTSTVADGTAPLVVTSTTLVTNLNADQLDGQEGTYYLDWTNTTNKPDPVITLGGDLTGSVTLTDLASGTLTATIAANSVGLGTDTTGNYVATIAGTANEISVTGSGSETSAVTIGLPTNVTVVGDLSADTLESSVADGTAPLVVASTTLVTNLNADQLDGNEGSHYLDWTNTTNKPDPVITLGGDLTGSVTLTDLASGTLTATIAANSVALGTDTTGNYVATIAGTANEIEVTGSGSETSAITVGLPNDVTITQDLTVDRDLTIAGNLVGPNLFTLDPTTISSSTVNYTATVSTGTQFGGGTGNVFFLENTTAGTATAGNPVVQLYRGNTYVFDVSDSSMVGHPLRFTADNGTTEYTTGVTTSGATGTASATVTFVVQTDAPVNLQYYCTTHGVGMGNITNQINLGGTVIISGDLQVDGTHTVLNSTELVIADKTITVAEGSLNKAAAINSGLIVDLGSASNASLLYNSDKWVFNNAPYFDALRLLTTNDLTGGNNAAFQNIAVTDTDATFSWADTGTATAPSNTGTITFVSGSAIDIDVDTTGYGVRIAHTDTSNVSNITASNSTNQFMASLAMTFDTFGHVQAVTPTYSNVVFNNDFGTMTVTDTDAGYTWTATGDVVAGQLTDTATYVSGDAIDIDVDATSKAVRWTNTDKGSDQLIIGNITVQNTTTGFTMSETGSFAAATNTDTITLIPLTGMDIDIDTTNGAFTFENTDTGTAQDIVKSIVVVDSSLGFTFAETGTYTVSGNTDSLSVVQGTGIDLDIDTTNGAIRITNDDKGSAQNIFKTVAITDTNSGFVWTETGSIVADTNADTLTVVSGTGIDLDADATNDAILITNTDTGSSQNIIKTLQVSDTDAGYTWTETGSIAALSNTDTVKFISGDSINIDVDVSSQAIRVAHDVAGANSTVTTVSNTFVDAQAVDAQGHVTSFATSTVDFNVASNYAFKTVTAGGTSLVADSNTDTLTINAAQTDSQDGIVISATVGSDTLTIAHADTSSISDVSNATNNFISSATFDTYGHTLTETSSAVDFNVSSNYAYKTIAVAGQSNLVADSSTDTLTIAVTGTGFGLSTTPGSDTLTFENTDKGSSQNIFKTLAVTDTNSGYTWAQDGSFAAAANSDTFTFVSGTGIDLDVDATLGAMLVINTDRGSVQNIFKSVAVTDSEVGFSFAQNGTINASTNTDGFTLVSGAGIDIDVDTSNKAIRIENTIDATDLGSSQDIIKSILVTDTDTGFTWSETGTYTVSGNTDSLTLVSGAGIDIDVDTTTGAIRIENPTSGVAFAEATYTGTGSQDTYALGTGFTTVSVYVNGVLVDDGIDYAFTAATGALVFTVAPSNGDLITTHKYTQTISSINLSSLGIINHDAVTVDSSGNVVISGNLTVTGVQTSSSEDVLEDPVLNLGGATAPTSDDNLDRGITFRWHDGTGAKQGFFGFDDTDSDFMFIPDSNGTNAFGPAGGGTDLADYGGAKFKHVLARNVRVGFTGANEIDTSSGNLTIDSAGGTTTLDDNVSIIGTLGVTDTATFTGSVEANNGITVNSTAFVVAKTSGNITTLGSLDVSLLASLDGGIDVDGEFTVANTTGNIATTGDLQVDGNTVLSGNVDIGNAATDTVTITSVIDSDLIPSQNVTYDLGSATNRWKDLYLSGNTIKLGDATISAAAGGKVSFGKMENTPIGQFTPDAGGFTVLEASTSLAVTGTSNLDGDVNIATDKLTVDSLTGNTVIAGTLGAGAGTLSSLEVSDLTATRIVIAGTDGELQDDAELVFDATTMTVGAVFTITRTTGSITAGEVSATGGKFGNVKIGQTGNNEIDTSSGNLTIDSFGGTTTIDDILSVSGAATFDDTIGVTNGIIAGGTVSMAGGSSSADFSFADFSELKFGTSDDLRIYTEGTGAFIRTNSGDMKIRIATGNILFQGADGSDTMAKFVHNGATELYYDNSLKIATTTSGIDVTGTVTMDGGSTSANFTFDDDVKATFGAGNDLEIYHDSADNHTYIKETGSGHLKILAQEFQVKNASDVSIFTANSAQCELFFSGNKKLETNTNGIAVTGTATITGDGTDVIVNSAGHELVLVGNRGATGTNLDKGYLRMKSESTNTIVLDTAGDSYLNGGSVGIGTDTPASKLHLYTSGLASNTNVTDMLTIELNRSDHGATPSGPAILFKDQDANNLTNEARIKMMTVNDTDFGDNDEAASNLVFETTNAGTASDKMIVTGRGDIGIGTINPTAKLDVQGGNAKFGNVTHLHGDGQLSTTTETSISGLLTASYRTLKYTISITRGSEYQSSEMLIVHDGIDAFITTYGTIFTGSAALMSFDADISGSNVRLLGTSSSAVATSYKFQVMAIDV